MDDVWLVADYKNEPYKHHKVKEELDKMGVTTKLVDYKDIVFPVDKKKSPRAARFVINQIERIPFQYAIIENLRGNGTKIVNEFVPDLNSNKATTYSMWKRAKEKNPNIRFRMADTLMTKDICKAKEFVEKKGAVLFKPIYSGGGFGIRKLTRDDADLDEKLNEIYNGNEGLSKYPRESEARTGFKYFHLQEFVPNKNFDIRSIAVGGKAIGKFARYNEDVLHNLKAGGMGCQIRPSGDLRCKKGESDWVTYEDMMTPEQVGELDDITEEIASMYDLDLVGVDLMYGLDDELYLLEVNPPFQFEGADKVIPEAKIAKKIAEFIRSKL